MSTNNDYGTVEHNGKTLTLTQHAYLDHHRSNPHLPAYRAKALDTDGNEYIVIWDVVDGWEESEDESNCCDWTTPYEIIEI